MKLLVSFVVSTALIAGVAAQAPPPQTNAPVPPAKVRIALIGD